MGRREYIYLAGLFIAGAIYYRNFSAMDINTASDNPNVKAFLAMIRKFESAGKYNVIYGGQTFDDFSAHPDIRVPFQDPRTNDTNYSTAAGAYQITYPTWLSIQAVAFLPDFSQQSQDLAALWLLKIRGALTYIIAGDFDNALRIASKTWASLPYTDSQQKHVNYLVAQTEYTKNGGTLT